MPLGRLVRAVPRGPETKDGFLERPGNRYVNAIVRASAGSGGMQGGTLNPHQTRA